MADIIQLRRDTAANWTSVNPVLAQGELGLELVTNKFKFGNGVDPWNDLGYVGQDQGYITAIAGENLGGDRVVYIDSSGEAFYASNDDLDVVNNTLGITVGAANISDEVLIQVANTKTDGAWSWTVGNPIFLSTNGQLTQTPPTFPTNLFSLIVAFPISSDTIFIRFREPIILS